MPITWQWVSETKPPLPQHCPLGSQTSSAPLQSAHGYDAPSHQERFVSWRKSIWSVGTSTVWVNSLARNSSVQACSWTCTTNCGFILTDYFWGQNIWQALIWTSPVVLISRFLDSPGSQDDDFSPGWGDTNLHTGVAILSELSGEELVQFSFEDAISDKL